MPRSRITNALRLALLVALTVLQAACFSEPGIYTVGTEVTPEGEVIQKPRIVSLSRHRQELEAPGPRARVDHSVHDFGRLDPLTKHQHTFLIYNDGEEPLRLEEGPTTCKCTVANLVSGEVLPGEKAHVVMQWNTGHDTEYSHTATIYTNDPRNRAVRLTIKGQVQVLFRAEPDELVFSRVDPGAAPAASTIVYSQIWDDFEVTDIAPSLAGVQCVAEPAEQEVLDQLQATSAHRITVTLPHDLPAGYFTIPVRVAAQRVGGEADVESDHHEIEVTLFGKVLRRLAAYGPDVDADGTIHLGRVLQGCGKTASLLLKMRDEQTELAVQSIETLPESLQVRLEPYGVGDGKNLGLYRLHVELPREAPTFRLPPDQRGWVRIRFDHPRVPELELPVDVIVVPRSDAAH